MKNDLIIVSRGEDKMAEEVDIATADSLHLLGLSAESSFFERMRCGDYVDGARWYVFSHKPGRALFPIPFLVNSRKEVFHQTSHENGVYFFSKSVKVANLKVPATQGWSTESIIDWVHDKRELGIYELKHFYSGIKRVIRRQVYLLKEEDYELLTLYVVFSYFYTLFKACGFLSLTGGFGSGKSHCSASLLRLGFNSHVSGQISAYGKISPPALCRLIDLSAGLSAMDDLEAISRASPSPSPLRQALLTSYKRSTATLNLVANNKLAPAQYALYSPKIFTSIATPEPVLGSRCFKVSLTKAPGTWSSEFISGEELDAIVNLGYQLSMSQKLIDVIREKAEGNTSGGRLGEISQGLRVLSGLIGGHSPKLLETYLSSAASEQSQLIGPFDGLLNTVKNILQEGYMSVCMLHLQAQLRLSGIHMKPTEIGKLCSSAALFKSDRRFVLHGLKTTDLVPSKRAIGMSKVSAGSLVRPSRSFCPQANTKKFAAAGCAQCRYTNVCDLQKKWQDS